MDILLVAPIKDIRHTLNLLPPLGLGYLASSIKNTHHVRILDCVKDGLDLTSFREFLKKEKPQLVGFSVFSCDLENVRKSIAVVKDFDPEIITVVGGPHPSGDPKGIFDYLERLDYAFAGEAEVGFPLFLDRLGKKSTDFNDIPGLVWKKNGSLQVNAKIFFEDLDALGAPSWDLLSPGTYRGVPNGVFTKQYPFAPIIVTRGCPYLCTFCSAHNIVGRKIRHRSVENVIGEIVLLHEKYGIKEIHIEDDNFTFNIDFAKEFCKRLIKLNLPLTYSCPNGIRLDRIDKELLVLMKKAGFYNIYVGVESGSLRILKHMKKSLSPEEIAAKVRLIKEAGLAVSGYFILGYPEETKEDIEKTISFSKSLNLDWAQFATFIPIPGSQIMENDYVRAISQEIGWSNFFNTEVPFSPKGITRKELKKMQKRAFLSFYLRPKQIYSLLKKLRRDNLVFIIRRVMMYIFK
ncbi:MAG: radical SAM protein [Candidatus Omnitrophica bacterium]|nr:radical SAM protein [Candidatus Omnitrophota bacterium]